MWEPLAPQIKTLSETFPVEKKEQRDKENNSKDK